MIRSRQLFTFALAIAAGALVTASAWSAVEPPRPFERIGHVPETSARGSMLHAVTPAHVNGVATVVVDAAWSSYSPGTTVTVGTTYTIGTDAFATIQDGIDAVDPGGTVKVLAGSYVETAAGRTPVGYGGSYQFGLFCPATKPGLVVEGVDAGGNPTTTYSSVGVHLTTHATDDFGPDGVWVDGDGVTLSGIDFGPNLDGANKTISVAGDGLVFKANTITDALGGALYLDDVRYDSGTNTSHIQSYTIQDNYFETGVLISIQDGVGVSGPASGRVISGNRFDLGPSDYWPSISFNGSDTGVPWFVWQVGGAVITGNTFVNAYPQGQAIRTRGTVPAAQFDWTSYWNSNTFDRKVAVGSGATPLTNLTTYSYPSGYGNFNDCRRIGTGVQGEVDHANAGDVVLVGGGTYTEQVVVNGRNVTIQGAGRASTTIQSPATLTQFYTTSANNYPVVLCENSADIRLTGLTVDGAGRGNGNYRFQGVAFWDAGGKILDCDIVRVRETPFNGDQHGVSVYAYNNTGGPYAIEVGGCNLSDFQKNAFALNGDGLTANVHDCTITGQGNTTLNAQNGVQIAFGASGTITNVSASGLFYTPNSDVACGILAYAGGSVTVSGFTGTNCQVGVYYDDMNGSASNVSLSGNTSGVPSTGVIAYNELSSAPNRAGTANSHMPIPVASPMTDDGAMSSALRTPRTNSAPMTVSFGPGCLTGDGLTGSVGVQFYSSGGPLVGTATGLELTNWDYAMETGGSNVAVTAHHNSIAGSLTDGFYSDAGNTNDATLDWWGAAGGPAGTNGISGPVTAAPWLITGADQNPGCGFVAGADNVLNLGPAPSCLSQAHTCLTIPVTIARTTSDNIRGYSVTLALTPNLALCSGTSSIVEGSYLSSIAGTQFEVLDNHDGTYTVDCAILGATCGATAATGTLFTLDVMRNGSDGTGTITLGSLTARNCDNGSVAVSAGAPLGITIDTGSPTAPTGLTATQVNSGNDADGTTKIALTFTAPGDAASVEVYRAGFGHYPEYDDAGGVVPAAPTYPPLAPWALTGVTASGQNDETTSRDFWYYVAFTKDGCGNVSVASTMTAGTLNYHLGDVVDPAHPASIGENIVTGADISRLGDHYGISLALNDPYNYLDVGPTTDFSVNARPTTDNKVGFEDLILFAINYGTVSAPQMAARPAAADEDAIALDVPALPAAGETFAVSVRMKGAGDVLAGSVRLAYDGSVVEPVGVEAGGLLQVQGRGSVVLSPEPGSVDFALLGVGGGVAGDGEIARVLFRVRTSGAPGLALGGVIARGEHNETIALGRLASGPATELPARTELGPVFPNPALHGASLQLSLTRASNVRLAVYDLAGRRVRTLLDSNQPAGVRMVRWNGMGDSGARMSPGVYVIRLEADGVTQSRRVQFLP